MLSHTKAQSKSKPVLSILDYIKSSSLPISSTGSRLYQVLSDLAGLESKFVLSLSSLGITNTCSRSWTAIALKACEVPILGQMPSYGERLSCSVELLPVG